MDILKFIIAGNVDDGKSTLTGRLLLETNNLHDDILEAAQTDSVIRNLAHFSDGLRKEREQGITIDVSYKFFKTDKRQFILIDAPGHFQYTKNLISGASHADLFLILVDINHGITDQTTRHFQIARFLGIKNIVFLVNKIDSVDYSRKKFDVLKDSLTNAFMLVESQIIPISALVGDNVCSLSSNTHWFRGNTVLEILEGVKINLNESHLPLRVQILNSIDGINYAKVISGTLNLNQRVCNSRNGEIVEIIGLIYGYQKHLPYE